MNLNSNQQAFFALVKAGLWEQNGQLSSVGEIDFNVVSRIAEEQSVAGLVAGGIEHVKDVKVPTENALTFVGGTLQLEQRNMAMNQFIAELIRKLREADIYAILVKGQGIAQCYERPLWRACGDIDLFLSPQNYNQASSLLLTIASSVEEENPNNKHLAMSIGGWTVELHGSLRCGLWSCIDNELDRVQDEIFYGGSVRSWLNGSTTVFLPAAVEDVVFVFSHILEHFFKEGIGLRQICDWCRLLWTFRDNLNKRLLGQCLNAMGVMTEWKTFASLVVEYLGMPVEAMPFYSPDKKWEKKADRVMQFVMETGNFGQNRDYSYYQKYPYVIYKVISMWKHLQDFGRYFVIFPLDSIKVTWRRMLVGFAVVLRRKDYKEKLIHI